MANPKSGLRWIDGVGVAGPSDTAGPPLSIASCRCAGVVETPVELAAINSGGSACASGGTASSTVVGRGSAASRTGFSRLVLAWAKDFNGAAEGVAAVAAHGRLDAPASARRWCETISHSRGEATESTNRPDKIIKKGHVGVVW